jgi:hypothetical protein
MEHDQRITKEIERLLLTAEIMSQDGDHEVELLLRAGLDQPLSAEEAAELLSTVLSTLRSRAVARGDGQTVAGIDADGGKLIEEVAAARARIAGPAGEGRNGSSPSDERPVVELQSHLGVDPHAVFPRPTFHEREIPMMAGFVPLSQIELWDGNERLTVHVEQFRRQHGRGPMPQELLDIMHSKMQLPGLERELDQFKVIDLARSIANNGVRQPPVIDLDGTLLDGNRRIAACHFIRASDEFDTDHKARVEKIFVWQLTEHAQPEERDQVIVALNFEPNLKQDWPDYVKAHKVYDEWRRILDLENPAPGKGRQAELKKALSMSFALGPVTTTVNRMIKMVQLADEFEDHQVEQRGQDESTVKHAASRHFQYFDELQKGANPGGVAHTLGQNDVLKGLVFDLLFQNKFTNWRQVRKLKYAAGNEDVVHQLKLARDETDPDEATAKVDFALALGETNSRETRELGANTRIRTFADWLAQLPMDSFATETVKPENVERLLKSLVLARQQARAVLGDERVEELMA